MQFYQSKFKRFPGTQYKEIYDQAFAEYKKIMKRTKRQTYVRSKYFGGQKIFLNLFWSHLKDKKNLRDKARRLKYFQCALDLIQHNFYSPQSKDNPNRVGEMLHRFLGRTKDAEVFVVQIKEIKKSDRKFFLSVFPQL